MSDAMSLPDERGLRALVEGLQRIAETVQTAPLTREELMKRWGLTEPKTLQRWCDERGLRPFAGTGAKARYRMTAVLRAEERGEQLNGGRYE